MAYPTFVAEGGFTQDILDITPSLPAGWQPGDLFFAQVETDDQPVAAPAGWSEIAAFTFAASCRLQIITRVAQVGDTNPTFVDAGDHQGCTISAFRGVQSWTVGSSNSGSDASIEVLSMNTTRDNALVLWCLGHGRDSTTDHFSNYVNANLSNITEVVNASGAQGNGGGVGLVTSQLALAGATGQSTTDGIQATAWVSGHIALYGPLSSSRVPIPQTIGQQGGMRW